MFERMPIWALTLLLTPLSAHAQQSPSSLPTPSAAAEGVASASPKSATDDPNYVIGPQDVLDISVWKEPELSRPVPVRPDGKISLPLLNDVQAAGLTPSRLTAQLTTSLGKFVTSPQVTVIVTQVSSQRIYILGEVSRAGAFVLLPGMTILQALANAGGLTQFANSKKIYVMRQEGGKQEKFFFNYKDVIAGRRTDQNIVLKSGDTVYVP